MNLSKPITRRSNFIVDAAVILGLVSLVFGAAHVIGEWRQPLRTTVVIDLSPRALPKYALFSLARGWIAYFFSLLFTLLVASWAYYDKRAQRFILPALDVLQSIPVLSFLPGLVLALVGLFPHSNTGLELACVLTIFTGQVWNMTFSYYDSLRGVPPDFRALAEFYDFGWWRRFWKVELPSGAQGLIYNSMVSMAGGWFFLSVTEAFQLNGQDFRVPGLGSYMSMAHDQGDVRAQIFGVIAMGVVILTVDRLVWWPLVLWSHKFNLDDFAGAAVKKSRVSLWLARSAAAQRISQLFARLADAMIRPRQAPHADKAEAKSMPSPAAEVDASTSDTASDHATLRSQPSPSIRRNGLWHYVSPWIYRLFIVAIVAVLALGLWQLIKLLSHVKLADWRDISEAAGVSFGRVMLAVLLGTLWTVPVGIWIGLNPKLSDKLQPFIQFAASFPAPMIYPWVLGLFLLVSHTPLTWGCIPLIMLGTQWYILFNVAASAAAIPNDIRSCSEILRLKGWRRWTRYLLPAVAPGLVTGWITAAGGAWNTTIVAEYVQNGDKTYQTFGLGALISDASGTNDFSKLTAASLVMAVIVVGINRSVWKKLQNHANNLCRFGA